MPRPKGRSPPPSSTSLAPEPGGELIVPDADSGLIEHLLSLDKLLNAAQHLLEQHPVLDRAALEHLRQLRVRVRFAISSSRDTAGALPKRAPALWNDRVDRHQSPLSFLQATYAQWLHKGLSRAAIRQWDRALYRALYRSGITDKELEEIGLPTKKKLIDQKLDAAGAIKAPSRSVRAAELSAEERERLRLYDALRRRKDRTPRSG